MNILITGATGYLGNLLTATLLTRTTSKLYLLVRPHHSTESIQNNLIRELNLQNINHDTIDWQERIKLVFIDEEQLTELPKKLLELNLPIDEIIHSAGCIDYFNTVLLEKINIHYTEALLQYARAVKVTRFIFISTAFAGGFREDPLPEDILPFEGTDPTEYTRTKRAAEHIVAESGLPFLILRPSIAVGDSHDGHYTGKRFGLYQQWQAQEKTIAAHYQPILHFLVSDYPINMLHQDAYVETFWAAYQHLPINSWLNMVSHGELAPTPFQIIQRWVKNIYRPQKVFYYHNIENVPLAEIPAEQRIFLNFTMTNNRIAGYDWKFRTDNLDKLIAGGLVFQDATLNSIVACEQDFVKHSTALQEYITKYHPGAPKPEEVIEVIS